MRNRIRKEEDLGTAERGRGVDVEMSSRRRRHGTPVEHIRAQTKTNYCWLPNQSEK